MMKIKNFRNILNNQKKNLMKKTKFSKIKKKKLINCKMKWNKSIKTLKQKKQN